MSDDQNRSDQKQYYIRVRGRVLGPFTVEKLRSLRSRGQFSRIHEISTDRRAWSPASSVDHLFVSGTPAGSPINVPAYSGEGIASSAELRSTPTGPLGAPPAASSVGASVAPPTAVGPPDPVVWYYRVNEQQFGPTSAGQLRALVSSGRLDGSEYVWRDGMLAWVTINDVSELSVAKVVPQGAAQGPIADRIHRQRRSARIAFVGFTFAVLVVGATIYFKLPKKLGMSIPTPPDLSSIIDSDGAIGSIEGPDAERRLGDCVGLVVTGIRSTLKDGSVVEDMYTTGTCFVVDREGHALTNKHVVEPIQKLMRARLLREQIKKDELRVIEPKVWVFFRGRRDSAEIVSTSENFDLAILKVNRAFKSHLRLSSSDSLPRGEKVVALGFPGIDRNPVSEDEFLQRLKNAVQAKESIRAKFEPRDFDYSRTDGTASKVSTERAGSVLIQHTARINRGNSGGPLLTHDGVVRGLNTLGLSGGKEQAESPIFYALSIGQLKEEIDENVKGVEWK